MSPKFGGDTRESERYQSYNSLISLIIDKLCETLRTFVRFDPFIAERRRIVDLVAKSHLPAVYGDALFVEDGGLMAYGPSVADLYRRAATLVVKVLRGTKPADIPVEQPMHLKLLINLKTAQALGLTMPPTLLFQADEVIR